jgi:hypothetical protein
MPTGPKGEKRPADVVGNAIKVSRRGRTHDSRSCPTARLASGDDRTAGEGHGHRRASGACRFAREARGRRGEVRPAVRHGVRRPALTPAEPHSQMDRSAHPGKEGEVRGRSTSSQIASPGDEIPRQFASRRCQKSGGNLGVDLAKRSICNAVKTPFVSNNS